MGPLLKFFSVTYVLTWICFITVAAWVPAQTPLGAALVLLGAVAPSIVATWLTARAEGAAGARALLGRIFRWRVPVRWYLFAVTFTVAVKLTVALIHRVATGAWPRFDETPLFIIPIAILLSTPVQAGEEVGWRGYALPRLAARFGLARASILLGLIWACWHCLNSLFVEAIPTGSRSWCSCCR